MIRKRYLDNGMLILILITDRLWWYKEPITNLHYAQLMFIIEFQVRKVDCNEMCKKLAWWLDGVAGEGGHCVEWWKLAFSTHWHRCFTLKPTTMCIDTATPEFFFQNMRFCREKIQQPVNFKMKKKKSAPKVVTGQQENNFNKWGFSTSRKTTSSTHKISKFCFPT